MTDIEAKALALVNDHAINNRRDLDDAKHSELKCALLDAVQAIEATEARHAAELREQAERFSEAALSALAEAFKPNTYAIQRGEIISPILAPFILPAPDPLVEVFREMDSKSSGTVTEEGYADQFRAAIEARGGKIVWEAGE